MARSRLLRVRPSGHLLVLAWCGLMGGSPAWAQAEARGRAPEPGTEEATPPGPDRGMPGSVSLEAPARTSGESASEPLVATGQAVLENRPLAEPDVAAVDADERRTAQADAEAAKAEAAKAEAAKAEAKRLRQERVVAFARRRVREMAERKRALAASEARQRAVAAASEKEASRTRARKTQAAAAAPLPELVDHRSALERQLAAHWGWGADKDRQVRVPLPDWQNWQRVRLFGVEHLAAFRYTKQHHTLTAVFAVETRAQKPSSLTCMDEFERRGFPELVRHGVHIAPIAAQNAQWDQRPVLVHETEGRVSFLFSRYEFSAAWTAYPAYDYGCLVYATVVLWDGQPELARRVLDRFVAEGVAQVRPLTTSLPARLEDGPAKLAPVSQSARERTETAQNEASAQRARRTSP